MNTYDNGRFYRPAELFSFGFLDGAHVCLCRSHS